MENSRQLDRQAELRGKIEQMRKAQEQESQVKTALRMLLDNGAYERLANIKISNPSLYGGVVRYVFSLAEAGKLRGKMTEAQLKLLASSLLGSKRQGSITRISK